jgi:cell division protein FtsI/penicillin-binding protein 2
MAPRIFVSSIDRVPLFSIVATVVVLLFIARLVFIQGVQGKEYKKQAEGQYVPVVTPIFNRGNIFLKAKGGEEVPIASLEEFYTLAIQPNRVASVDRLLAELTQAEVIFDASLIRQKAAKTDDPYEEIVKDVSKKSVDLLKEKKISGLFFNKNYRRIYPQQSTGSQVVGFVGSDGATFRGQYGLERSYDDTLERISSAPINVFADVFSDIDDTLRTKVKKEDADIVLTMDPLALDTLHKALVSVQEKWSPEMVGGIIMDPKTGKILAMDSLPSFDPNSYAEYKTARFVNPNVESVFEMGSIIKALTMAAGIDSGAVTPETTYNDKGMLVLNGYKVSNFDKKARGVVSMQEVLNKSLNTGVTFVMQEMGQKNFARYFREVYALVEKTGIDLPNEVNNLVKNLQSKEEVNYATASFGQGIALTPIATIRALAVLANGGYLVTPYVADEILYKDGTREKLPHKAPVQTLKKESSETITRMLVHVVDTELAQGTLSMKEYALAAKTGTAEIPKAGGGYREDAYLHSFFGYYPAYEPRFIVLLYQVYPKGGASAQYASQTLTAPFFDIAHTLLSYFSVPPDRNRE